MIEFKEQPPKEKIPQTELKPEEKEELNLEEKFEERGIKNGAEFNYNGQNFQIVSHGPNGICYSKDGTLIEAKWFKGPQEFFALQDKGEIVIEGVTLEPASKTPEVPPVEMEDLEIKPEETSAVKPTEPQAPIPERVPEVKPSSAKEAAKSLEGKVIEVGGEAQEKEPSILDKGKGLFSKVKGRVTEEYQSLQALRKEMAQQGKEIDLEKSPQEKVPTAEVELFTPTGDWQEVPEGVVLPNGMEIKMNLETGKNMARDPKLVSESEKELTPEVVTIAGQAAQTAQEFLEKKLGYLDVKPQAIFDRLTDDEVKNLEEFFKSNNEEQAKVLFKDKIDEILTGEQKQTLLNEAGAQEVANNIYKILQETIENEARFKLAKMDCKKAGKITWNVFKNASLVWGSAILLGTLGVSTAGIGGAAGLALISFGIRKYSQYKREKNAAKTSAKYQKDFTKEKKYQQKEFFKDKKAKEKLSAVISNELRRQSSQKAKQALNEYETAQVAGSPEVAEKSLDNISEVLWLSAVDKLSSEHPDWSVEQIDHSARLITLTLIQHERNENAAKATLEELEKSQPKVYQLINKFNLLRSGQIEKKPKDANPSIWNKYKYDLLSIGLGTGIGLAVRTNEYVRIASGAIAGAGYGYFMAEHFGRKKGEEKALLAVEQLINEAEAKIRDITFPSEELEQLKKDALYVQGRLNLGILDKNPLLKSRAENFIHQVNQLEYKNQEVLDDLIKSEYKKGEQLEKQQRVDVRRLEKKIKKYRTIGLVGGAIFGGVTAGALPYVTKEIRSWFGGAKAPVQPEKVPATETAPSLPESVIQKLPTYFPGLKLDKPALFTTVDGAKWHYNPADTTVFSETAPTHKIPLTDFLNQHKDLTSAVNQEVLETPAGEKAVKVAETPPTQETPVPPSAETLANQEQLLEKLNQQPGFKQFISEHQDIQVKGVVADWHQYNIKGTVSGVLGRAMGPNAEVTVINPDGTVLEHQDADLVHFSENGGDAIATSPDGKVIYVFKSSGITVHEGDTLEKIRASFTEKEAIKKGKSIPPSVEIGVNLVAPDSRELQSLKYNEIPVSVKRLFAAYEQDGKVNFTNAKNASEFWNEAARQAQYNNLDDKEPFNKQNFQSEGAINDWLNQHRKTIIAEPPALEVLPKKPVSIEDLLKDGLDEKDWATIKANKITADELQTLYNKEITIDQMVKDGGLVKDDIDSSCYDLMHAEDFKKFGFLAKDFCDIFQNGLYKIRGGELAQSGYELKDLIEAGFTPKDLMSGGFSIYKLTDAGIKTEVLNQDIHNIINGVTKDIKLPPGDQFIESKDDNDLIYSFDLATKDGIVYYSMPITQGATLEALAEQATNDCNNASANLTKLAEAFAGNRNEAAHCLSALIKAPRLPIEALTENGEPTDLSEITDFLHAIGKNNLELLKLNGDYSTGKLNAAYYLFEEVNRVQLRKSLELMDTEQQVDIANKLVKSDYPPLGIIKGLTVTHKTENLNFTHDLCLAELVAIASTKTSTPNEVNDSASALFGEKVAVGQLKVRGDYNKIVFENVQAGEKKLDSITLNLEDIEHNKIIIQSGKARNPFDLTDENLNKVKEQLTPETPAVEAPYSQEIIDLQKSVESGLGTKFTPETITALQKEGYQMEYYQLTQEESSAFSKAGIQGGADSYLKFYKTFDDKRNLCVFITNEGGYITGIEAKDGTSLTTFGEGRGAFALQDENGIHPVEIKTLFNIAKREANSLDATTQGTKEQPLIEQEIKAHSRVIPETPPTPAETPEISTTAVEDPLISFKNSNDYKTLEDLTLAHHDQLLIKEVPGSTAQYKLYKIELLVGGKNNYTLALDKNTRQDNLITDIEDLQKYYGKFNLFADKFDNMNRTEVLKMYDNNVVRQLYNEEQNITSQQIEQTYDYLKTLDSGLKVTTQYEFAKSLISGGSDKVNLSSILPSEIMSIGGVDKIEGNKIIIEGVTLNLVAGDKVQHLENVTIIFDPTAGDKGIILQVNGKDVYSSTLSENGLSGIKGEIEKHVSSEINLEAPLKGIANNTYDIPDIGKVVVEDGWVVSIGGEKVELTPQNAIREDVVVYFRKEGETTHLYTVSRNFKDSKLEVIHTTLEK